MEFKSTNLECNYRYEHRQFDPTSFSSQIPEDALQTVPDLECLDMTNNNNHYYAEQAVPDACFYSLQLSPSCETTPVRMDGAVFAKKRKITPLALNFDDDSSDSSANPESVTSCKPMKRKKKNRRSYLSSDLPEEIRNQRRTVANARERARVGRMANGYDALQKALPKYLTGDKMRKVDILNSAVCHIQNLMRLLAESNRHVISNTNADVAPFQNFWDSNHEEIQRDIMQYKSNMNFFASIPNLSVESCSFLEEC